MRETIRESSPAINLVFSRVCGYFNNKIQQIIFPLKIIKSQSQFMEELNIDNEELMNSIVEHAGGFVTLVTQLFSGKGILLDYSIESLEILDAVLEEMKAVEWKGIALECLSYFAGCYICETVRKNYGGEYQYIEEEDQVLVIAGLSDFYVAIRPFQKVANRIINGKEDSIPFYIEGYKEHLERGKKEKRYSVTLV